MMRITDVHNEACRSTLTDTFLFFIKLVMFNNTVSSVKEACA